ncbi:MAG: GNAT family protein [Rhizobiaceae bacterium]
MGISRHGRSGAAIVLKELDSSDVTEKYVDWMNDGSVVQYTDARLGQYLLKDIQEYVAKIYNSSSSFLFGIFEKKSMNHIGNIKIGPVDKENQNASIGLIIGDKNYWGAGIGTEAIGLVTAIAFEELRLYKVTAGVIAGNDASTRAFLRNGFVIEGTRRDHINFNGEWRDQILLGRINGV